MFKPQRAQKSQRIWPAKLRVLRELCGLIPCRSKVVPLRLKFGTFGDSRRFLYQLLLKRLC